MRASAVWVPAVVLLLESSAALGASSDASNATAAATGGAAVSSEGAALPPKYVYHSPPSPPLYLSSYEQTFTVWSLFWGIGLNAAIGLAGLLLFGYLRLTSIYSAKLFRPRHLLMELQARERERDIALHQDATTINQLKNLSQEHPTKMLPQLPAGGWIKFLLEIPDEDIAAYAGLDSLVFIRFYKLGIQLFLPTAFIVCLFLGPIYWTGGGLNRRGERYHGPDRFTISNVRLESGRFWWPVLVCYGVSIYFIYLLGRENKEILRLRLRHVCSRIARPEALAVLVTDIPSPEADGNGSVDNTPVCTDVAQSALRSINAISASDAIKGDGQATAQQVEDYFRDLYPGLGDFPKAVMVPRVADVERAWEERNRLAMDMHVANAKFVLAKAAGRDTAAAQKEQEHAMAELSRAEQQLRKLRVRARHRRSHTAFVVFPSRRDAAVASQTLHSSEGGQYWKVQPAPEQRDVIWRNMHLRWYERMVRWGATSFAGAVIVLNFLFIVAFIASLVTLRNLEKYFPNTFAHASTKPRTESFFNGYLASAVLMVCLFGAPYAFRWLAKLQGLVSASDVESTVSLQYFWLLIIDVFFGSAVTEAILRQLDNVLRYFSFAEIINSIALSVPAASQFFLAYVLTRTGTAFALQLLRVYSLPSLAWTLPRCWTVGQERRAWAPEAPQYGDWLPTALFILALGLVYSTIAPLMLLVVAAYFAFGFIVFRYQLLYVYAATYQTNGRLWLHLFNCSIVSLVLSQVVLGSVMLLRGAGVEVLALLPIVVATLAFHYVMEKNYSLTFRTVPRDVAEAADRAAPVLSEEGYLPFPFPEAFYPPCMYDDSALDPDRLLTPDDRRDYLENAGRPNGGQAQDQMMDGAGQYAVESTPLEPRGADYGAVRSDAGAPGRGPPVNVGAAGNNGWWTRPQPGQEDPNGGDMQYQPSAAQAGYQQGGDAGYDDGGYYGSQNGSYAQQPQQGVPMQPMLSSNNGSRMGANNMQQNGRWGRGGSRR